MLYFMNNEHLPGDGKCPWVEVPERIQNDATYVAKSSFKLDDTVITDGWIVRDHYFTWDNATHTVTGVTSFVNTQETPEDRNVVATYAKYSDLPSTPPAGPGERVIVLDDEMLDYNENLYEITATGYAFVKTLCRKYRVIQAVSGHADIEWDTTKITFKNTASKWYKLVLALEQAIPKPNTLIKVSATDPEWQIGDLLTVGYNTAEDIFYAQYVGVIEGLSASDISLRVLVSDYAFGGIHQYPTYAAFPDPTITSNEVNTRFIYIAQDTQYAYIWHDNA